MVLFESPTHSEPTMISSITTLPHTARPEGLPASTAPWEMWWSLVLNAKSRGDRVAKRVALAQYNRAVELEIA